jgi:hypothetical protein
MLSVRVVVCYGSSLPLAHVLEFTVEQFAIYLGIPIGYGVRRPGMEETGCGGSDGGWVGCVVGASRTRAR